MKERLGVEVTFVDISDVETFRAAIRHNTKVRLMHTRNAH